MYFLTYLPTYLPTYGEDLPPYKWVTKMKPDIINSVEIHPKLCGNSHPVDGAQVGALHWVASSLWPGGRLCSIK
jgi:hypothetical protein